MKNKKLYIGIGVLIAILLVAGILLFVNKDSNGISLNTGDELKNMVDKVYDNVKVELPLLETHVMDVNDKDMIKSYTGLSNNDNVEALVVSEPLMTSQAYSFVSVKFKDGTNINKVKEEMYNNINMDKWLCVSADVLYLTSYKNTVIYVMSDEDRAKPVFESIKNYLNNKNGKDLVRNNVFDELPNE